MDATIPAKTVVEVVVKVDAEAAAPAVVMVDAQEPAQVRPLPTRALSSSGTCTGSCAGTAAPPPMEPF